MPTTRTPWLLLIGALLAAAGQAANDPLSREAANRLLAKAEGLRRNAETTAPKPSRVVVTETEVNSYLAFDGPEVLPTGVVAPRLTLHGGGRVTARAIVDLDAVRRARNSTSWFDPLNYLRGQLPVSAAGVLTARDGSVRVALERAEVSGIRIPKILLQEVVTYYTRSPEFPNGVNLDDPFPLPARIRSITVDLGAAVVEQ